jgi:membrane protein implicated in regulation of membrane protease activity
VLLPRLVKRFVLVTICVFLALVLVSTMIVLPVWVYALSLPTAALLTVLYWRSFRGTTICPTCHGTGKIQVQHGREIEVDLCYSCDGEGRVPTTSIR